MLYFNLSGGTFSTSSTVTAAREGVATTNTSIVNAALKQVDETTAQAGAKAARTGVKHLTTTAGEPFDVPTDLATCVNAGQLAFDNEWYCVWDEAGKNKAVTTLLGYDKAGKAYPVQFVCGPRSAGIFLLQSKNGKIVPLDPATYSSLDKLSVLDASAWYAAVARECTDKASGDGVAISKCYTARGKRHYSRWCDQSTSTCYAKFYDVQTGVVDVRTAPYQKGESTPLTRGWDKGTEAAKALLDNACEMVTCPTSAKEVGALALFETVASLSTTADKVLIGTKAFCSLFGQPKCAVPTEVQVDTGGQELPAPASRYPTGAYTRFHKAKLMWIVYGPAGSSLSGTNPLQTDPDNPGTVVLETTAAQPAGLPVRPPLDDPFYLKAWFWGAVGGAAVVAASTAVYVKKRRSRKA